MKINRIITVIFEAPDAHGQCDMCGEEDLPLIIVPGWTGDPMTCWNCAFADDRRGEGIRQRFIDWWEQSAEEAH